MITKENLIKGEYYKCGTTNIFIWGINDSSFHLGNNCTTFSVGGGNFSNAERLATDEERHWLNMCIEANKYIEYEEAILTFNQIKPITKDDPELSNILIKLLTQ